MKKAAVVAHFGSVAETARALGITPGAVSQWPDEIPARRALQLERITRGKLKAARDDYETRPPRAAREATT